MSSFIDNKSEFRHNVRKYSKLLLRYTLILILWLIKESVVLINLLQRGLTILRKYIIKYSIYFWRWLKWALPIAWCKLKWASLNLWSATIIAWHAVCKATLYISCWIKVVTHKIIRLLFVFFWRTERWSKSKHEEYLEFKRTKGVKGLVKDAGLGVKTAVNRYMDEEQIPSTEAVFSDDELIEEEMGHDKSIQIGKKFDNFVKKIVNEK